MGKKVFNGKCYFEPEVETQAALASVGIYTFRYYPQDKIIMSSDYAVVYFGGEKFITDLENNVYVNIALEKGKIQSLFEKIENGSQKASTKFFTKEKGRAYKITMSVLEKDDMGKPVMAAGIIESIDKDIRQKEMIYALGSNFNSIYYVDVDNDKVYVYTVNSAVESMIGEKLRSIPGYEDLMADYVNKTVIADDRETMLYETSLDNLRRQFQNKNAYQYDYRIFRDGKIKHCRAKFVNVSKSGCLHAMIAGFSDVSSEKERELERMAYVDRVTGGPNYESFKKKLRDMPSSGYMISMDVHSFKIINSICGVTKGDETLKEIWKCIEKVLYDGDIAGHINADRFVIFSNTFDESKVCSKLNILKDDLRVLSENLKIPSVIPYFGITKWNPGKKVEEAYSEANFAKNRIKDRKDVDSQFYSEADTKKMLEEKAMEDAFIDDLQNGRFEVWYQPKYSPEDEKLIGAEGLIRWRLKDGSLMSPAKFIPLFERDGLIKILDEYVFRNVCNKQMEWKRKGLGVIPVSINLSRASLYFESVVKQYHSIASEIGVDTELVPIEITESAAIDNENIKALADRFHSKGFSLMVDDFGAGYSSLATLNMKCFDTLKIDKSLIDYIGDFSGEKLLEHTIALAKDLGLNVTAEGVETEEQVDFLRKINCDSIQGYYYSKPLPEQEFKKLL